MEKYIQVLTTTNKKKEAEKIAETILKKKLAGCVQIIGPIKSHFWWKGKIEKEKEWLLFIKTKRKLYKEIENTIKEIHSYGVPEIIAFSIIAGNKNYLEWLKKEVKKE